MRRKSKECAVKQFGLLEGVFSQPDNHETSDKNVARTCVGITIQWINAYTCI